MPNKPPMKMGHSPAEMSPYKMGHSPNEMGHSPNEMSLKNNKDIKYAGDVADETAQKSAMKPFTHKHFGSRSGLLMKGALEMGHSPAEMGHSPLEIEDDGGRGKARKEYDIRKGILDPETGKRTYKESKRKQKVFVTKMGKVLPVGSKAK